MAQKQQRQIRQFRQGAQRRAAITTPLLGNVQLQQV